LGEAPENIDNRPVVLEISSSVPTRCDANIRATLHTPRIEYRSIVQERAMKRTPFVSIVVVLCAVLGGVAFAAQDRFTVKVPNGLAFSDFRGYETWQDVAASQTEASLKVIAANNVMINAYRQGVPGNGKPFPEGSKIVKIEWTSKKSTESPVFRDGAGHAEVGFVHRKGYQEIPGHQGIGIRPVSL
jgi:hypothetical protein